MAVASAGPYASLHLTTQFFTGQMPFLSPNQQRQSTEGTLAALTTYTLTKLLNKKLKKKLKVTVFWKNCENLKTKKGKFWTFPDFRFFEK